MRSQIRSKLLIAYLGVALTVGSLLVIRGLGRINTILPHKPVYDLVVDWRGARAYWDGFNPYSPEGLVRAQLDKTGIGHPPSTLFWALTLAPYELPVARQVLFEISILLLLIQLGILARDLRVPYPSATAWLGLGLVLCCDWVDYFSILGQWSQVIAFAYFLAWYSLRRGWEVAAGIAIGAACTIKVFPGLLLLMLVLGRRWKACIAAASIYVLVAILMTSRIGIQSWPQFLAQQSSTANQWMASIQNQSIHGFVLRFFYPTCGRRGPMLPLSTIISVAVAMALVVGAGWLGRKAARTNDRVDLIFALTSVLSVFLSNWAWEHYNFIFILPIVLVGSTIPVMKNWDCQRAWIVAVVLLLSATLLALPIPVIVKGQAQASYAANPTPQGHLWLHVSEGINMVPVMALTAALFILLWLSERRIVGRSLSTKRSNSPA